MGSIIPFETILDKCDLLFEDNLFSRELLMRIYSEYLSGSTQDETHVVNLTLHTGSIAFDALAVAYAALSNLMLNEKDSDDIVLSLDKDSYVLYGKAKKERFKFSGIIPSPYIPGEDCVLLTQDNSTTTYVPPKMWRYILPYNGTSTRTDGRGIRRTSGLREEFFKNVLEINERYILGVNDTSTVFLASKERADRIVKGLAFLFDGKTVPLLELVTASYFTENIELRYGGNTAQSDPILKFTGKASVAREQIRKRDGNKCIGVIVLGNSQVSRNYTELPEMLNRKSLRYAQVLLPIASEFSTQLLSDYEDARLFACTKAFLLSFSVPPKVENDITEELNAQGNAIIDRHVEADFSAGFIDWNDYKSFGLSMYAIKKSDYESEEKDIFVMQAYSLMNLFSTAAFDINVVERLISERKIEKIISPARRIDELRKSAEVFPAHLQPHVNQILNTLETGYLFLADKSNLKERLWSLVQQSRDKKIAIVTPKAYYAEVFKEEGLFDVLDEMGELYISTAKRFDHSKIYDLIISIGNISGKNFDLYRSTASQHIVALLYDFEKKLFNFKSRKAAETEKLFDKKSAFDYNYEPSYEEIGLTESTDFEDVNLVDHISEEIDEYIIHLNELATLREISGIGTGPSGPVEIVAVASFETGEYAFFTKMYKAYVFNNVDGEVKEVAVGDLSEGDMVVFTRNNEHTRDIVDELLQKLIDSEKLSPEICEYFAMSKHWRSALISYMQTTSATAKQIADKMIQNGIDVHEQSIYRWLDPDSHMVGPRKLESLQQIALLIEDEDMLDRTEAYFDACNVIRKVRGEIQREIGRAIISHLNGENSRTGIIATEIYDRIDSLSSILCIERITQVSRTVPINAINRPLTIKE